MEQFLMVKIETLRYQMVQEALDQGGLTNERVVYLSQKLDKYIVFYQKFKKKSSKGIQHKKYSMHTY
jgi:hypothetical protein